MKRYRVVPGIRSRRGWRDYGRNVGTALSVANTALKGVKLLSGMLNVEYKRLDNAASVSPDTSGSIINLTHIAQGDGDQNRDGNQVEGKSIRSKFYIQKNSSATTTIVRIIWFIDNKSVSGSTPAVTDVLETATPQSMPNFENRRRFSILADRVYNLGDITMTHSEYFKKVNMKVTFADNTSTSGNDNQLYCLHLSNEPTNKPTLLITHRFRYIDN